MLYAQLSVSGFRNKNVFFNDFNCIFNFFVGYYKKYKAEQEVPINSEIKEEDYQEIQEYISKTYNIDIHEILFTLIKNPNNKNLIRFELKLENNSQEKNIKFDDKKKK
ncbi:hypothetical protein [Treponema pedis]|uniref:hypothetical protein n=1 Tax=Treponema pedis TaxID=409322 RepID=UPI0019800E73|nr:hypothetical protein [Treponema pedis]